MFTSVMYDLPTVLATDSRLNSAARSRSMPDSRERQRGAELQHMIDRQKYLSFHGRIGHECGADGTAKMMCFVRLTTCPPRIIAAVLATWRLLDGASIETSLYLPIKNHVHQITFYPAISHAAQLSDWVH